MKSERRSYRRVKPKDLRADIYSFDQESSLNAEILDISRTGIRIKINKPLDSHSDCKVKISMSLPDSGAPFSVNCLLQNRHSENEYGLQYTDHMEGSIDDMLFECIKLKGMEFLIKSSNLASS